MYVNFTKGRRVIMGCIPSLFLLAFLQVSVAASRPDAAGASDLAKTETALQQQISGQVTDSASQPLEGVSVKVKDGQATAVTDGSGRFSINVPNTDATLVFTFIGYANQEVALQGHSTINVTMVEERSELNEVVVVGYGTQRKSDVTGAVTSIGEAEIQSRPVSNALEAMQGKIAGVDISTAQRPGTVGDVNIRGVRSLTASNSPLFVVDGIPLLTGGIDYLNPNDIEAIDVLKDASATAIYGSRGANGVVIVTTKKGKEGRVTLDLNLATTFENLVDNRDMFNAPEYITFRRWAYYYRNPEVYPRGDEPTIENDRAIFLATGDPTAWANIEKGWAGGTWDGSKVATTDWFGMVTQQGVTNNMNVSATGGSEKIKTYASFGYLDNKGTQKGQSFKRYTANLNAEVNATKWFSLGGNLLVSYGVQEYGQSTAGSNPLGGTSQIYDAARAQFPYALPYDAEGNRIEMPGGDIGIKNVAEEWILNQDQRTTLRTFGSLFGQVDFGKIHPALENLTYRLNFGPDFSNYRAGSYIDSQSVRSNGTNEASLGKNQTFSYTLDHLLFYNETFGKHDLGLTLLHSQTEYNRETSNIAANGVAFPSQKWNALSDTYISAENLTDYSSGLTKSQLHSYMARVNYGFNNRYLLTASIRRDGASQLAEGHKYSWFPSAALAWRIDQEDFVNVAWLNDLKLRLGVGVTGNSAIDPYETQGAISSIFYPYISSLAPGAIPSTTMANQELGWEKTTQYNVGLDFSVLNRRISGSLDFYQSKTTDLLLEMSIPTVTGFTTTFANVGETANKGVDLSLTSLNVDGASFKWTTTASVAWQKDRIVSLATGSDDINNNWFIDQPIGVIYGYRSLGLWHVADADIYERFNDNGATFSPGLVRPEDVNGDDKIDANNDRMIIGNTRPRWVVGMTNRFNYKGVELSVFLYSRLKYLYDTGGESQTGRGTQRRIDYYTENNTDAEYQKPIYTEGTGDPFHQALGYRNGSFIKIRNISLGYNMSNNLLEKSGISTLKIYVQATNPGMLFSEIDWVDLDVRSATFNRGFTIGLNATL
ncbi:SusC/RagA family TonB-linked outer membrane protein [Parapedobacter soli]|uniref:SusC/RagA family TonB-linked outer membrane protein n=1 Tax=Parapedobacter soli TaxID=416955 RepID=UPI0021C9548C|nr:TonB-dependent receptor [Parapedobacter soli]